MHLPVQAITTFITFALIGLLLRYIKSSPKKEPVSTQDGKKILKFGNVFLIIGAVGSIFGIFLATLGILFNSKSLGDKLGWLGIAAFMILLSLPMISTRMKIVYDDESIEYIGPFGKVKILRWSEIKNVVGNSKRRFVRFTDGGEKKISISFRMMGFEKFLDTLKTKISPSDFEQVNSAYIKYQQQSGV